MLRALQQGGGDIPSGSNTTRPDVQTYPPALPHKEQSTPSRLEEIYLRRSGEYLKQFGYEALGQPTSVSISQSGALSDKYILSTGDELVVTLRGQENSTYRVRIDRDGTIILPKLSPILAAGRRFGEFRSDLEAQVAQAFLSTKVFVAAGNLHQLSILVSGEVGSPGVRIVSGLASPLDVILLSGGIKKTGSLRRVRVSGPSGSRLVDLYSVVAQGNTANLGGLRDGDTVYVPPINSTAAVTGAVTRPGIFELPPGSGSATAVSLLRLAGGPEIAGSYTLAKISVLSNGGLSLLPAKPREIVRNGEVLVVIANHGETAGRVSLRGAVSSPGIHTLALNATVGDLFHSATDLTYDGYAPFALILRRDTVTNAVTIVPFSIAGAIRRTNDIPLQSEDLVYVMTRAQVASMARLVTKRVNEAYSPRGAQGGNFPGSRNAGGSPLSGATPAQSDGGISPRQSGNAYMPAPPSAGQELPPGVEPPVDRNVPPFYGPGPNDFQQYQGGSGLNNSGSSVNNSGFNNSYDPNGAGGYNNGNSPFQNDPRIPAIAQNNSAEAAALAQAQALASRNGRNGFVLQPVWPDEVIVSQLASLLHVTSEALLSTASDNLVWILDDVREPGPYIGAPGSSLADMIQAAGGVQQSADLSSIEVTSTLVDQHTGLTHTTRSSFSQAGERTAMVSIRPLDVIRLRPVFTDREQGTVTVAGQVRFPGEFDITRNERLSSLLRRAGGLSEVAYPYGAIYTRKEAAIAEKQGNERSARELENELPTLIASQSTQGQNFASASPYLASLAQNLRTMPVLGRIVITADPAVLAVKPELDFILQPGDTLFVPKRPSTVTVVGEVLNPGAFQYKARLRYSDYVSMAGGATQSADSSRTFIVYPNGSSAPIDTDWFSFEGGANIPPGSTIVVPRDLRPFNWSTFLKDVTLIASQLAVTAASLSVLQTN